jgi:hypothetical protein
MQKLHATFGMKIAPVVAENKRRSIWGWSIQAKRTVIGSVAVKIRAGSGKATKKLINVKNTSKVNDMNSLLFLPFQCFAN